MDLLNADLPLMGQMICETMMQLPADETTPVVEGPPRRAMTRISGAWNGLVAIDCPTAIARRAAAVMFGLEKAEPSDDDLRDAVLELANVVGGNIKALLPDTCRLSLPTELNADPRQAFVDLKLIAHFDVPNDGLPMSVTVFSAA